MYEIIIIIIIYLIEFYSFQEYFTQFELSRSYRRICNVRHKKNHALVNKCM